MEKYIVGGWVRDYLLNKAGYHVMPADKDWVVVGSTPEEMIRLGFIPVGEGFPVFLHPTTHEEYALARTERKNGRGYKGFTFYADQSTTLEDDLLRRDLTINAMAIDRNGVLYDPYGGQRDLENKILRHVSDAFSEDPLRLLRVARFSAKLPDFKVSSETWEKLLEIVQSGEFFTLSRERVFVEMRKGLGERKPSNFFRILIQSGLMSQKFDNWNITEEILRAIDLPQLSADERFCLSFFFTDERYVKEIVGELRMPKQLQRLSRRIASHKLLDEMRDAQQVLETLKKFDALKNYQQFSTLLTLVENIRPLGISKEIWLRITKAVSSQNFNQIANLNKRTTDVAQYVKMKQIEVIQAILELEKFA